MSIYSLDLNQQRYIESNVAFERSKSRGFWEVFRAFFKRENPYLVCFDNFIQTTSIDHGQYEGIQDIRLNAIHGSVSRPQDFTRQFSPRSSNQICREKWRNIYVLATTGVGFPPVELYQVGDEYVVQDGHTRISVAAFLGWKTIQAHVTLLP